MRDRHLFLAAVFFCLLGCTAKKQVTTLTYEEEIAQHREEYKEEFLADDRSPIFDRKHLENFRFFAADKTYRCLCEAEVTPEEKPFDMATYSGETRPYRKYANLSCSVDGKTIQLGIYQNINLMRVPGYKDHLFLPFMDATNGETTYGGGRYMDFRLSDISEGTITVDFNKAYNPWCAFADGYSCPIPPQENHLDIVINAGEQLYAGQKTIAH